MNLLEKHGIDRENITAVSIYLDDNVPDYMDGITRIGSVLIDTETNQFYINELVNNDEFRDEEIPGGKSAIQQIEEFVNEKLGLTTAQVIE